MTYQPPPLLQAALDDGRVGPDALDLYRSFERRYAFPLDEFQVRAILAILEGSSVIVSAPTGAGKTLIAEFAIHEALLRKRRIAYTTPLKALSNQKYADFCRQFGVAEVGILTGDVKVNPRAPILVMTTEILRNMFYTGTLEGLAHVVLDECHYMGDEGRGTVWEEIIVNAPKDVTLVGLSATVANVRQIAEWISLVHRPIVPIVHPERPVPLQYLVADLAAEVHPLDAVRSGRAKLVGIEDGGDGDRRGRFYARRVASVTAMIEELEARQWLPAIYFIFSRTGCERALEDVLGEGRPLLDGAQRREVERAIGEAVEENPVLGASAINQTIFQAMALGVGVHHAGILPSLKRLTEVLFERGLVRVVFATETMSLGIHMPARSVVLQGLTKRTDRGFRTLSHNELTQMAGRAGRRGIDPEGQCVLALDARDSLTDVLAVVDGPPEPIESQFRLGYGSVALLLQVVRDEAAIRRIVESSFGQFQNLRQIKKLEAEVVETERALGEAERYEAPCGELDRIGRYRALRAEAEARRRELGMRARPTRSRGLEEIEPGRVVLLRQRGGSGLGVVLGTHRLRGNRVLVDALLPHGSVVRTKPGNVKRVFWATPPLLLPPALRDLAAHHRGWGRDFRETLGRDGGSVLARLRDLDVASLLERERGEGPEDAMERIECHACPWEARPRCDAAWRQLEKVQIRLEQRRTALATLRNALWQEFLRVMEVLDAFDAVQKGELRPKGRLVAALRHDHELLVAECVSRGVFDDATPAEVAALASCLTEEARSGEEAPSRLFLKQRPKLRRRIRQMEEAAAAILAVQRRVGLYRPVSVQTGFVAAVQRWASGDDDWPDIVAESFGGHEGDLIRAMRRLIDVLRQLAEAPEVPDGVADAARAGARTLDRGIVLESALI
ncbi:MAG: DEAD/DEAH box helicase [Candidatus Rokubacteria bacterium]|nr:DEAD/DEAH box helicase [Candidatus Rokubacteria bacterium]